MASVTGPKSLGVFELAEIGGWKIIYLLEKPVLQTEMHTAIQLCIASIVHNQNP